jgi:hypothetical protein
MDLKMISKQDVVLTWTCTGIDDFFMAFYVENKFPEMSTFFCHQGLEKLCKAYLLGLESDKYEKLPEKAAREFLNKHAKGLKHWLAGADKLIDSLIRLDALSEEPLKRQYAEYDDKKVKGHDLLEWLDAAYEEARYPFIPVNVHEAYPLKKGNVVIGHWAVLSSSTPTDFAFDLARKIIRAIEKEYEVAVSKDKPSTRIYDDEWERFCRLFFCDN